LAVLNALAAGAIIGAVQPGTIFSEPNPMRGPDFRGERMFRGYARLLVAAACFSLATVAATAQEVVHALTGVVKAINPASKTIIVATDDGSDGIFTIAAPRVSVEFDKNVRSEATAAGAFNGIGSHVIVFYYGVGGLRTVVALHDLGAGPFKNVTGTVVKYDKGQHSLSVEDPSGAVDTYKIVRGTIADTDAGVAGGLKFDPDKGRKVNITATDENGVKTILFISGA
jgi:hypothetical protein